MRKATDSELQQRAERNARRNNLRSQRLDAIFGQAVQNRDAMRRAGVPNAVGSIIPTPREIHSDLKGRRPAQDTEEINLPYLNEKMKLVYSLWCVCGAQGGFPPTFPFSIHCDTTDFYSSRKYRLLNTN